MQKNTDVSGPLNEGGHSRWERQPGQGAHKEVAGYDAHTSGHHHLLGLHFEIAEAAHERCGHCVQRTTDNEHDPCDDRRKRELQQDICVSSSLLGRPFRRTKWTELQTSRWHPYLSRMNIPRAATVLLNLGWGHVRPQDSFQGRLEGGRERYIFFHWSRGSKKFAYKLTSMKS